MPREELRCRASQGWAAIEAETQRAAATREAGERREQRRPLSPHPAPWWHGRAWARGDRAGAQWARPAVWRMRARACATGRGPHPLRPVKPRGPSMLMHLE
eukprot:6200780-Pleurochrysis_carterae.AAC.2